MPPILTRWAQSGHSRGLWRIGLFCGTDMNLVHARLLQLETCRVMSQSRY
jgi:hypothetical protein